MSRRYFIEDEIHAEPISEHATLEAAIIELERLAGVPWDDEPNRAPCTSWRTCERNYEILEVETSPDSRKILRQIPALEVSAKGVVWNDDLPRG
ncbi:MAG: hypothetical protein DWQ01_15695 [Planctomycetota bacterium]|nr:MAG: hypothetical protein DWQ01_15695 [Planctomycetota bacterium]